MSGRGEKRAPARGFGARVFVQCALFAVVLAAANYLSFKHYWRWDFSRSQDFRLAMQTRQILRSLRGEVELIVYFSPTQSSAESLIARDIESLMREIVFSGKPKVKVEFVDPQRNLKRAQEVAAEFGFAPGENLLLARYDGRTKMVPLYEMADFDFSPAALGEPPRVAAFRGEQVVASLLLGLLDPEERTVYFLQGHGEAPLGEGSPISLLLEHTRRQNAKVAALNLAAERSVPEDAAAVFIVGARYDISGEELKALEDYHAKDGRIFLMLDPDAKQENLSALAAAAGIRVQDTRVLRTIPLQFAIGIVRDVAAQFTDASDVVKRLQGVNALLPDPVQSLAAIEPAPEGIKVRPLMVAAEPYWAETEYVTDENKGVAYDDGIDGGYPVYLAFASDGRGVKDDRVEIPATKMIAVGNYRFILDEFLGAQSATAANLDFAMSGLNWLLDRHRLTGVVPKTPAEFKLTLSERELGRIAMLTMVAIPGAAALLGILVWLRRRS